MNSSWHAENMALTYVRNKDFSAAATILMIAIKHNIKHFKISYRLHDLLALICIKYPENVPTGTLDRLAYLSSNTKDQVLIQRSAKWIGSSWRSKILDAQSIIFNKNNI